MLSEKNILDKDYNWTIDTSYALARAFQQRDTSIIGDYKKNGFSEDDIDTKRISYLEKSVEEGYTKAYLELAVAKFYSVSHINKSRFSDYKDSLDTLVLAVSNANEGANIYIDLLDQYEIRNAFDGNPISLYKMGLLLDSKLKLDEMMLNTWGPLLKDSQFWINESGIQLSKDDRKLIIKTLKNSSKKAIVKEPVAIDSRKTISNESNSIQDIGNSSINESKSTNFLVTYLGNITKRYFNITDTSKRAEYWLFTLMNWLLSVFFAAINEPKVFVIFLLYLVIPTITLSMRRMNDISKPRWYIFIPIYGFILVGFVGRNSKNN